MYVSKHSFFIYLALSNLLILMYFKEIQCAVHTIERKSKNFRVSLLETACVKQKANTANHSLIILYFFNHVVTNIQTYKYHLDVDFDGMVRQRGEWGVREAYQLKELTSEEKWWEYGFTDVAHLNQKRKHRFLKKLCK